MHLDYLHQLLPPVPFVDLLTGFREGFYSCLVQAQTMMTRNINVNMLTCFYFEVTYRWICKYTISNWLVALLVASPGPIFCTWPQYKTLEETMTTCWPGTLSV